MSVSVSSAMNAGHARLGAPLAARFWPAGGIGRDAALVALAVALLTASAKFQVPFYPVPMTLQTFVVLVLGVSYGGRLAAVSFGAYLLAGAAGLPVFAGTPEKGIGLAYMLGPTGGYLLGMWVAAALLGRFGARGRPRHAGVTLLAMLVASALVYAFGLIWLGAVIGWDKPLLALGLWPFLAGDLLKVALAAVTLTLLWRLPTRD